MSDQAKFPADLTCCVVVIADLLADSFGLPKTGQDSKPKVNPADTASPSKDYIIARLPLRRAMSMNCLSETD